MRRRDVVAPGGENHYGVAYTPKVGRASVTDAHLTPFQFVANEQVLDDRHNFLAAEEIESAPPAFKFKKPLALGVYPVEKPGIFFPNRLLGLQVGEVLHQPRPVETAVAEIGHEMRQPGAAQQSARDAHRVHTRFPGPVREG